MGKMEPVGKDAWGGRPHGSDVCGCGVKRRCFPAESEREYGKAEAW